MTDTLPAALRRLAECATDEAQRLTTPPPGTPLPSTSTAQPPGKLPPAHREARASMALDWTRAAHEALQAHALAAGGQPLEDDERAELAALIVQLRERAEGLDEALERARSERRHLGEFLHSLAAEFRSAETSTASRVADRIVRALASVGWDVNDD